MRVYLQFRLGLRRTGKSRFKACEVITQRRELPLETHLSVFELLKFYAVQVFHRVVLPSIGAISLRNSIDPRWFVATPLAAA